MWTLYRKCRRRTPETAQKVQHHCHLFLRVFMKFGEPVGLPPHTSFRCKFMFRFLTEKISYITRHTPIFIGGQGPV